MRPWPSSFAVRRVLVELTKQEGTTLTQLSRAMGRNPRYLSIFTTHGRPEHLDPADRAWLARYFNIDEVELGKRD